MAQAGVLGLLISLAPVPFMGNIVQIGCGMAEGNPVKAIMGVAGLGLEAVTFGASTAVTVAAGAVRAGKKGVYLQGAVKVAKQAEQKYRDFKKINDVLGSFGIC